MTTIAYRDGVLAADTLSTSNGLRDAYGCKVWRIGRLLVAAAGSRALCLRFRDWVAKGLDGDNPFAETQEGNGLVVTPDGQLVMWGEFGPWPVRGAFYSLGSGYQVALGAMEAGASATEAVAIAMKHGTQTGGTVMAVSHT